MRRFYALMLSHVVATYAMLAATRVVENQPLLPHRPDGQDVMVLILSPLYSWYMLLEPLARFGQWPLHTAVVWGSYLPAFFATYHIARRRARLRKNPGGHPLIREST